MLRLYIYKLCFQFCISFPMDILLFSTPARLCMIVAWINQSLVVWYDIISRILCERLFLSYLFMIIMKHSEWQFTFTLLLLKILWNFFESGKCRSNSWRNSFAKFVKTATIRRVKSYDVTVALFFYMTQLLEWQANVTVTTVFSGLFILYFRCLDHFLIWEDSR